MEGEIKYLVGKKILSIDGSVGSDELTFNLSDGNTLRMYHSQDCCESVEVEDICGDIFDIIGEEIILAEKVTSENENPEGVKIPKYQDSFTWTFYRISTKNGLVTIRWYGESNGYYSESVDISVSKTK